MITTIQITHNVKEQLEKFKLHPRETFNETLQRLLDSQTDDEPLSEEALNQIESSIRDIKENKVFTTEQVRKRLNL